MQQTTLKDRIAALPRVHCAHLPTPLEPMTRLSEYLGGPRLWIKRDDCTGLATGGNKARKLEFLIGDALDQGADTVITPGAIQSKHCRQTAADAALQGFACHLLFENRVPTKDADYVNSGNVLLDHMLGATTTTFPADTDMSAEMDRLADTLRTQGRRPYIIPGGGSNPVGATGYANAAVELLEQCEAQGLNLGYIVHGTGSAGTQAGLVAGVHGVESEVPILGIGVRAPQDQQEASVYELACRTAEHLGIETPLEREKVVADCGYVGDGYGLPTDSMLEALGLLAKVEGILLDPVYSGKGMAGLIGKIREGFFDPSTDVVFLHTGGAVALFGYRWALGGLNTSDEEVVGA